MQLGACPGTIWLLASFKEAPRAGSAPGSALRHQRACSVFECRRWCRESNRLGSAEPPLQWVSHPSFLACLPGKDASLVAPVMAVMCQRSSKAEGHQALQCFFLLPSSVDLSLASGPSLCNPPVLVSHGHLKTHQMSMLLTSAWAHKRVLWRSSPCRGSTQQHIRVCD